MEVVAPAVGVGGLGISVGALVGSLVGSESNSFTMPPAARGVAGAVGGVGRGNWVVGLGVFVSNMEVLSPVGGGWGVGVILMIPTGMLLASV